jgi:hypothetical protein
LPGCEFVSPLYPLPTLTELIRCRDYLGEPEWARLLNDHYLHQLADNYRIEFIQRLRSVQVQQHKQVHKYLKVLFDEHLTVRKLLKNILQDFFIALRQHQNVLSN